MRRLLALLMLMTLTLVSATSVAAAVCQHRNAQEHAAALDGAEGKAAAADARAEDMAGAHVGKSGEGIDFTAFALAAFILPETLALSASGVERPLRPAPADSVAPPGLSTPPLLEPPAA